MSTISQPIPASPSTVTCVENEDPHLFQRARTWWTLLALFLMAQGNGLFTKQDKLYYSLKTTSEDSTGALLAVTVVMLLIIAALMRKRVHLIFRLMLEQKAILAFSLLAFASILWSQEPQLTLRHSTVLFFYFGFAWYFATEYSFADQMRLILCLGFVAAAGSIFMALVLPQYGIAVGGEWKGIFGQKNRLGLGIFYLFSGLPFRLAVTGRGLINLVFQATLPICLILLSQSKTSLIMTAVIVGVRIFGPFVTQGRNYQLPFRIYLSVVAVATTVLLATFGRDIVLPLLGRDSSLTGRTDSWGLLLTFARRHLWVGYGYQAFWTGTGDSLSAVKSIGAAMHGADSGYLDTLLQFGVVGIGMLLLVLFMTIRDFIRVLHAPPVPRAAYWSMGVIIATFIGSSTEALFLITTGISTFVFVVACADLRNLTTASTGDL